MRDLIWTIIIIWLAYKVVEIFRGFSGKKESGSFQTHEAESAQTHAKAADPGIKKAVKQHLDNEGEYVDFEEVKS